MISRSASRSICVSIERASLDAGIDIAGRREVVHRPKEARRRSREDPLQGVRAGANQGDRARRRHSGASSSSHRPRTGAHGFDHERRAEATRLLHGRTPRGPMAIAPTGERDQPRGVVSRADATHHETPPAPGSKPAARPRRPMNAREAMESLEASEPFFDGVVAPIHRLPALDIALERCSMPRCARLAVSAPPSTTSVSSVRALVGMLCG